MGERCEQTSERPFTNIRISRDPESLWSVGNVIFFPGENANCENEMERKFGNTRPRLSGMPNPFSLDARQ